MNPCRGFSQLGANARARPVRRYNRHNTIVMDCASQAPRYPCTQSGLTSAIAAAGIGGTVVVPANRTVAVTSSTSLSVDGLTFRCEPGAALATHVAAADPFYITHASDVTVEGCHFKYSSGAQIALAVTNTAARIRFRHNLVEGFPAGGANIAVAIGDRTNRTVASGNTDVELQDNVFAADCGMQVDVADYNLRVHIVDNFFLPCSYAGNNEMINVQTTDPGTMIRGLQIGRNMMWNQSGGDCVQVQPLSGGLLSILHVTVAQNRCTLVGGGGNGTGYSLGGQDIKAIGNAFDANGQKFAGQNPPFEIINCVHCSETGDIAQMGIQSNPTVVFSAGSVNTGESIDDTFARNVCVIEETGTASTDCFMAGASTAGRISRLTFTGNVADMSRSTTTGIVRAVWVQCNSLSATCVDGFIVGNRLDGPNRSGNARGVVIEQDAGTMCGWVVSSNLYRGWSTNLSYTPGTLESAAALRGPKLGNSAFSIPQRSGNSPLHCREP